MQHAKCSSKFAVECRRELVVKVVFTSETNNGLDAFDYFSGEATSLLFAVFSLTFVSSGLNVNEAGDEIDRHKRHDNQT